MLRLIFISGLFFIGAVTFAGSGASQDETPTSLTENYKDWMVQCTTNDNNRICRLSQVLVQKESRQKVISLEVSLPKERANPVPVSILVPFGLKLSEGIVLDIDGKRFIGPLSFLTCLPAGCVVALNLNAANLAKLKQGDALLVHMAAFATGNKFNVKVSLAGFTAGFNRLQALANATP